jgi:exosortase
MHRVIARRPSAIGIVVTLVLAATAAWAYRSTLGNLLHRWSVDPEYSHGYLVPLFSLGILWFRRSQIAEARLQSSWGALALLGAGAALYLAGNCFYFTWLEQISLLPVLAAICMAVGGWPALRWAWPAIVFLLFMIPLPGRAESLLANPLQRISTLASTNALQTLGFFAQAEGNVILLSEAELGVVEACSGLRMLVVFFAVSTAVAIVQRRSLLQRFLIVLSAIPIALSANVLRITLTGVLHETVSSKAANFVFHDVAGWLMIPLALAFLALELWFLGHLFIVQTRPVPEEPLPNGAVRPEMAERHGHPQSVRVVQADSPGKVDTFSRTRRRR